ncbi:hypothetical protein FNW02_25475 [Komarekiella sp. 'clone 1']|uniref:Uncharacterized protein n=1 Tax=Komarekiella delphini-convector SJRDD-AB1 TaxID=2593771 RepID=A0AA40VTZ2_9NOST|nr:hypothetical protein [Komarekiella delphini-convector]MBD6619081.1 hypothetical protein [Komarekiella delphini-convector SJRDD-AB1]
MTANSLPSSQGYQHFVTSNSRQLNAEIAQERVYSFLADIVKQSPPEDVLREFKSLFIDGLDSPTSDYVPGIYGIFFDDKEQEFRNTLKRCCYIIINNWETNRKYKYIQELVNLFTTKNLRTETINSPIINICKCWLDNFINSNDYKEIKLFAARYNEPDKNFWTHRYTSYLLVAQSLNENNSKEQQEAARKLSKQIKDKFKFELAMYIARCQSAASSTTRYNNPSILGDNVLHLIKVIVLKKGVFSHKNIANIFVQQTKNQILKEFKGSIIKYLFFSVEHQELAKSLKQQFVDKLSLWKTEHNEETITKKFFLRTCNRVIDFLTTENGKEPSSLFLLLLSQGNPLTLVIILLKIILICRNSRIHLEARIAHLIYYYEKYSADECKWVINFIEIFNITFAIYADNVEYNLIQMKEDQDCNPQLNLDTYRVFSQLKANPQK